MKRRFILSIIFLFSIEAGVGLASTRMGFDQVFREQPVTAYEINSSRSAQLNPAKSDQTTFMRDTDKLDTPSNSQPSAGEHATPPNASEMVKNLNNKAMSKLPVGWIHIREEKIFDRDTENNGVFPNDIAIPNHQINDIWYCLDESHQVVESVSIMRSAEGEEIQVGVYSNGTAWNSATRVVEPSEPYVLNALDGQFLWDLNKLGESDLQPQITEEMLPDGRKGLRFVIQDKFEDKPLQLADYKLPVIQAETRALFSQDDGYLHNKEVVFRLLDGSERVSLSLKQEITFEEPPAEVLSYLEMKEKEAQK